MDWISTDDALPNDGAWVLIYAPGRPWDAPGSGGRHLLRVVQFERGRVVEDDEDPPLPIGSCDQDGNNLRPYCWTEFGPTNFDGQEATHWASIDPPT